MGKGSESRIKVRPARGREAALLSELAARSKAHWGYSSEFLEACRAELTFTPEQIEREPFCLAVAELDAAIAGFYALEEQGGRRFELEALYVDPAYMGGGVGRALIEEAKREVQRRGGRELVIQGDPHAEGFYLAAGAVKTGMRESGSIPGRKLPMFSIRIGPSGAERADARSEDYDPRLD